MAGMREHAPPPLSCTAARRLPSPCVPGAHATSLTIPCPPSRPPSRSAALPHHTSSPTTGDSLELAVLVALKAHDEAALERAFIQLKTFYADTRCVGAGRRGGAGAAGVHRPSRSCGTRSPGSLQA
jgi:hypothetical protein